MTSCNLEHIFITNNIDHELNITYVVVFISSFNQDLKSSDHLVLRKNSIPILVLVRPGLLFRIHSFTAYLYYSK